MKHLFLLLLALGCPVAGLSAQETKIAFRTLCLGIADELDLVILPGKDPESRQEVNLYTDLSPVVEGVFLSRDAEFFIGKTGADGKPGLELVAKAPLGRSARQLMVFTPTGAKPGTGKLPYALKCYDDDLTSFGMGYIRAVNESPVPVRFVISGQTTPQIPPGKSAQFPHSTKVNEYNMYPVVVEFLSGTGQWVKGQSVSWKATDRRREIVFTLVDATFKQPTVRVFSDIPPWTEQPVEEP